MKQQTNNTNTASDVGPHIRAAQAIGTLKHRRSKRKKKLSKFERRYTALGPTLKPEQKRIDYVLVHKKRDLEEIKDEKKKMSVKKKEELRNRFEKALSEEGFSIKSMVIDDLVFTQLHCPFKRLCKEAEVTNLEMPLKGCEKYTPKSTWFTEFKEKYFETDNEVDFISAPFQMRRIHLFENFENPTDFFRPALRSLLTHHILINLDVRDPAEKKSKKDNLQATIEGYHQLQVVEDCLTDFCFCCMNGGTDEEEKENKILSKMGLPYFLMKEVYTDAYILHEDSAYSYEKEREKEKKKDSLKDHKKTDEDIDKPKLVHDPRKELNDTWTQTAWWKFLPLWKIRNYYGEKIALYFAWSGLLILSLWLPFLFGFAVFIYGLTVSYGDSEHDEMPQNLTDQEELRWRMGQLYDTLRGSFDNHVTPFFALTICLWGTVFLELWKRRKSRLAYEWDVDMFEQNEPDRPQFFGTKLKKDPVTNEDDWFYPFKRQILKYCLSSSALILMIFIVFISLAAVIVYRVIMSVDYCTDLNALECLFMTNLVSALLNAISILILGKVYDWVAVKLTDWENHRTQTQYDDSLIVKIFAFQFANSYASCFYIAFFRGKFDNVGVFGLGSKYSDSCEGGNCMSQLSFQVLVLMLAKPFPKFFKDIILPSLKRLWRSRPECCRSNCCNNQVTDDKWKKQDSMEMKKSKQFLKRQQLKPELGDFTLPEYTEKVIIYGFLMIFAASFPLAPMIALLTLAVDIRIDAKRLLWFNRRPIAFIAQDLGMWFGILNFVNLIGVITNGFLIAFTSSWGQKYELSTRLWICIGFEHIVFALKFFLAYLIPDVPKDVTLAIRREKYQVAMKFDEKLKPIDYSKLIPVMTPALDSSPGLERQATIYTSEGMQVIKRRVKEDSFNYGDFDVELSDEDGNIIRSLASTLPTLQEDEKPKIDTFTENETASCGASLRDVHPEGSRLHLLSPKEKKGPSTETRLDTTVELDESSSKTDDPAIFNIDPYSVIKSDEQTVENSQSVDPYSVVTHGDMEARKNQSDDDDVYTTTC